MNWKNKEENHSLVQNRSQRTTQAIEVYTSKSLSSSCRGGKSLTLNEFFLNMHLFTKHILRVHLHQALCRVLGTQWWANQTRSHPLRSYVPGEWDYSPLKYWRRKEEWNWKDDVIIISQRQIFQIRNTVISLCYAISHIPSKLTHQNSYPGLHSHTQDTKSSPHSSQYLIFSNFIVFDSCRDILV